jgi:hypothetical protein
MIGRIIALALTCYLGAAMAAAQSIPGPTPAAAPTPAARAKPGQFVDLTRTFTSFADTTANLPDEARIKAFHDRFDPIIPGYYSDKGDYQARFDGSILKTLKDFPENRAKFVATAASFDAAFERGQQHFRHFFPDYQLSLPVYLVHSINQQDGGTRTVAKRTILFFGADVIGKIHDDTTIGPFLDHELFHAYHARYFPDCDQLWCSLWQEGMAVYVSGQMNPGLNDRQMMFTLPRAIRPEVEPRLAEAMCRLHDKFNSVDKDDYAEFFFGQPNTRPFPPRYGYFLGYLLVQKIGATMPLTTLAKLPPKKVKPLLEAALASYGACPAAIAKAAG